MANSSGAAALMSATGSNSVVANDLALSARPLPPNVFGIFFFSTTATQIPFGNGVRCVGGTLIRLPLGTSTPSGELDIAIDNTLPPAAPHLTAGSTWNFQAYFRDAAAGGSNFNLSDGYRITFQP